VDCIVSKEEEEDDRDSGPEGGEGGSNFLCFDGELRADRALVDVWVLSEVVDALEPMLSAVESTLIWRMSSGLRSLHRPSNCITVLACGVGARFQRAVDKSKTHLIIG
jgi:hypothetical protein